MPGLSLVVVIFLAFTFIFSVIVQLAGALLSLRERISCAAAVPINTHPHTESKEKESR